MSNFLIGEMDNFPQIKFLKKFLIGHPGIIAGGCFKSIFTGKKVHDVDMFFRSIVDYTKAIMYFEEHKDEYSKSYNNLNVQSFIHNKSGIRIECIKKIFGTPEEIIGQFDFTITKFAYEIQAEPIGEDLFDYSDNIIYHPQFFEHITMKRLVVDDLMPFPVSTFNRTYKYAKDGFFPCRETKMKIITAIHDLSAILDKDLSKAMYEGLD